MIPSPTPRRSRRSPDRLRERIDDRFGGRAFAAPLFDAFAFAVRLELAEGGHPIDRFLGAHRRATEVCEEAFGASGSFVLCLTAHGERPLASCLPTLRRARVAGVLPNGPKAHWAEEVSPARGELPGTFAHRVAFEAPTALLGRALWCALAGDLGIVRPRPFVTVHLFDLEAGLLAFPYDDRGMDVVSVERAPAERVYRRFAPYRLAWNEAAMAAAFL